MKLDALKHLSNALFHMDLARDPGAQRVAQEIAGELTNFITDNEPPTLAEITQDTIDAARYRKLRSAYHNIKSMVSIQTSAIGLAPMTPGSFDAWVDALPS